MMPKKGGLPNLFISNRYRGANLYGHYFGGVFIKAQDGIKFKETFSWRVRCRRAERPRAVPRL